MRVPAAVLATKLPAPGTIAAGAILALVVIVALSLLMRRRPDALPLLAIAALPFRLPITADGRTVNLLIPLYLVVAAGTLTFLLPRRLTLCVKGSPNAGGCGDRRRQQRMQELADGSPTKLTTWLSPIGVEWLLLGAVVLYALQGLYSSDHAKAAENVAFFYVPVRPAVHAAARCALDA